MPLAYSYLRFSSPQQATGDSIRRQTEAREKWLAENPGVALDTALKMTDAGRSGYRRRNWDTYARAPSVALCPLLFAIVLEHGNSILKLTAFAIYIPRYLFCS